MTFKMESCYNDDLIKKMDWCYPCRTYTEKYMFYDFEATQNTGTHTINLSSHKTSTEKNTYITVLRNSVNASLMTNLRGTASSLIISKGTTATSF